MKERIVKLLNCFIAKANANNNVAMKQWNNRLGFTLIELLIVIAVLGILVAGILVVLNPVEQTRRANDSSRLSSVSQLATAVTAYSTSQLLENYDPLAVALWQTVLKDAEEIKQIITVPEPITDCISSRIEGNICSCTGEVGVVACTDIATNTNHTNIIIWTTLDSTAERTRAGCNPDPSIDTVIATYDSSQQKTGTGCVSTATPVPDFGIILE